MAIDNCIANEYFIWKKCMAHSILYLCSINGHVQLFQDIHISPSVCVRHVNCNSITFLYKIQCLRHHTPSSSDAKAKNRIDVCCTTSTWVGMWIVTWRRCRRWRRPTTTICVFVTFSVESRLTESSLVRHWWIHNSFARCCTNGISYEIVAYARQLAFFARYPVHRLNIADGEDFEIVFLFFFSFHFVRNYSHIILLI